MSPKRNCLLYLLVPLIFMVSKGFARQNWSYSKETIDVQSGQVYLLKPDQFFTAVVIEFPAGEEIQHSAITTDNNHYALSLDEHAENAQNLLKSNLISFNGPQSQVSFSSTINGQVTIHYINSAVKTSSNRVGRNKSSNCEEPSSISQTQWRSGLDEPNYQRIYTPTKHVIIHHSAGSNSNTNYTQVVRDIYIYHTQVNNWSDIGYNYLVAQDGTIFKGRDPELGDQDVVQGAHFCGKNSNTMGICLLGNYTNIPPESATLSSLVDLVTWKMHKDQLDPLSTETTNGIPDLGILAGHRDGCATECPGTMTYGLIDSLKKVIASNIKACEGTLPDLEAVFFANNRVIDIGEAINFENRSVGNINRWKWSFEGASTPSSTVEFPGDVTYNQSGFFNVQLIVYDEFRSDTMIAENYVHVKEAEEEENTLAELYPNPLRRPYILKLNLEGDQRNKKIELYNLSGSLVSELNTFEEYLEFDLSFLDAGSYVMRIKAGASIKSFHLVVL